MRRAFERIFAGLARRRWLLFFALGAAVVGCLTRALTLSMDEDITSLLPSGDPVVDDYRMIISRFRNLDRLFFDIGLEDDAPGNPDDAAAVADELFERFSASGYFGRITYRFSPDERLRIMDFIDQHKALLFTEADAEALSRRLAPEAIRQRLEEARRALIEPQGVFLKDSIRRDPLGFREVFLRKFADLSPGGPGPHISDGRIWSQDRRHILMIAEPRFPASNTWEGAKLIAFVDKACEAAGLAAPGTGVKVRYAGGHRAILDNRDLVKADVSRTLTASLLAIFVLAFLTYRRRLLILLTLMPVAFGALFALGIFSVFTDRISAIVVGCGAILVGIAVDYAIHILYRYDNFTDPDISPETLGQHLSPLCVPLLMGAGTTAAAFVSLRASSLPGQRDLGLFAAVGIVGAVIFALVALPQMLRSRSPRRKRPIIPLDRFYEGFFDWHRRHERLCLLGLVAISIMCALGVRKIRFDGDMRKLNGTRPDTREDEEHVISLWGDSLSNTLAVSQGTTPEDALRLNDRIEGVLRQLKEERAILSFSSVAPVIPSLETQRANARRWRKFWSKQRRAALRENTDRIGTSVGFTTMAFEPFWTDLMVQEDPVAVDLPRDTFLADLLDQRVATSGGETLVLSTFKVRDPADYPAVAVRIRDAAPNTILVDGRAFADHASDLVRTALGRLGFICLAVVVMILFLFLGRLELVLAVLCPLGLSLLWTLGILGLFDIPINMMNSLFIIFIFGMAVDYAIFLVNDHLSSYRGDKNTLAITGGAITISALTTMCGFGALILARHPALFTIGVTATVGMGTGLAASLFAVPLVMRRLLWNDGRDGVPTIRTVLGGLSGRAGLVVIVVLCRFVVWPLLFLRHPLDASRRRGKLNRILRFSARALIVCFPYGKRIYLGVGKEAFRRPAVIVCNHQSPLDILCALALPVNMRIIVKPWVWNAPLIGPLVRSVGYLCIKSDNPEKLLDDAAGLLREGVSILVFPEGTRSRTGEMLRFKKGAFELAVRTNSDILPVVLCETRTCFPNGAFWIGDHRFVVSALPRVSPRGCDPRALAKHVRRTMQDEYERLLPIACQGKEFRRRITARYDYRGPFVERYAYWKLRFDPIYTGVGELVPKEARILDLGCGYGLTANILAAQSSRRRILGVDFDTRKITVASRAAVADGRMTFEAHDIVDWELPEADVVLLIDMLHYWPPHIQDRVLAKTSRCLTKGGRLIMREACDSRSLSHMVVRWTERFSTLIGHNKALHRLTFRSEEDYFGTLSAAGFARVEVIGDLGRGSNRTFVCEKANV